MPTISPSETDCFPLATPDLSQVSTRDLNAELARRDGVSAVFLGPDDELRRVVRGPAWVLVNRD
jgi:hypothetical protein